MAFQLNIFLLAGRRLFLKGRNQQRLLSTQWMDIKWRSSDLLRKMDRKRPKTPARNDD